MAAQSRVSAAFPGDAIRSHRAWRGRLPPLVALDGKIGGREFLPMSRNSIHGRPGLQSPRVRLRRPRDGRAGAAPYRCISGAMVCRPERLDFIRRPGRQPDVPGIPMGDRPHSDSSRAHQHGADLGAASRCALLPWRARPIRHRSRCRRNGSRCSRKTGARSAKSRPADLPRHPDRRSGLLAAGAGPRRRAGKQSDRPSRRLSSG